MFEVLRGCGVVILVLGILFGIVALFAWILGFIFEWMDVTTVTFWQRFVLCLFIIILSRGLNINISN